MGAGLHQVRRQRWAVRADSVQQALAIRTWLHDHCDGDLQDALEAAFDRLAPDEQVIRLRRLVVHLRVDDISQLVRTLPERVVEAMTTPMEPAGTTGARPYERSAAAPIDEARLVDYLLTGVVSWPARPDSLTLLTTFTAVARASATSIAATLVRRAPSRGVFGTAVFRLLQLIDERDWAGVIEAAAGTAEMLSAMAVPTATFVERDGHVTASDRRLRLVVSRLIGDEAARARAQSGGDATAADDPRAGHRDESQMPSAGKHIPHLPKRGATRLFEPVHSGAVRIEDLAANNFGDPFEARDPVDGAFPIVVVHAGLVLLHPFLPQFFHAVGLKLPPKPDPESRTVARAAALLNYVATGSDEPYELRLGFVKLLLGLAPDTPVPVGAGLLSDANRQESGALLQSAIEHWGALKQTSMDALRTSFLQRPGLVKRDDNRWSVHIEPGPFDVLLKRLPWSLVLVKLPWMHTPLHCQWPTP